MKQGVFITQWHPATVNQLLSNRWKAARLKKSDRAIIAHAFHGRTKAAGRRAIEMEIILKPGQRGADPDAYFKSLLDALVHAGALIDDNRQHVELKPVQFGRSKLWGTYLMLEDIA